MSVRFEDVLRKMGWNDGFQIPVSNKENQKLEEEVARLMLQKAKATIAFENATTRFDALEKHLKYVNQEHEQNQMLLTAHKQQLEDEDHRYQLIKSEKERTEQDTRQALKVLKETEERNEIKKTDLTRGVLKLEKLKSEMSWDAEALNAWEESLKKRDEDNELLKKFTKEDERKANELEARRQNLQIEYATRRKSMDKMIADVTNYEHIMERIGKVFKQQRVEREALVNQWQEAVKNLRQRDDAIERTNMEISQVQDVIAMKLEEKEQQNQFLANQVYNNKELEVQIEEGNFTNSKLRRELNDLVQYVLTLSSELNTTKKTLTATANFLEKERANGRNLDKDIVYKEYKIDELERTLVQLQKKLENVKNSSMTASERAKYLEQIIDMEQKQIAILTQDLERTQSILFRSQQALFEQTNLAKIKEQEINGFETTTNLLRRQAKTICNELQKQKEIVYDLDYRISQMESRLMKLEGQSNDEEIDMVNRKVAELEKIFSEHLEIKNLLQRQVNQLQDEMRRITNAMTLDSEQMHIFDGKLKEQILLFECGRRQSITAKLQAQQKQVEENVLRLRVNQYEKAMKKEDKSIYSLQKFRLEMDTAMREREIEINTNKEILLAKKRNLEEERGRLKCDIMSRHIRIDQFQKKYHIALMALGRDEDGNPLSVTHFKIKNAQEKYMLQQEGDELDQKIRTAEKEIIAMENTLKVVNFTNVTYRQSLSSIEEDGDEIKEMKDLEEGIRETNLILRKYKRELDSKKEMNRELEKAYKELEKQKEELKEDIIIKEESYADILRGEYDKQIKIERAERHLKTVTKKLVDKNIEKYNQDLEIRMMQDANKNVLHNLSELAIRYQEITPLIDRYMKQYKLELPGPRTRLTPSTSTESARSMTSTSSGGRSSGDYSMPSVSNVVFEFDPSNATLQRNTTSTSILQKSKSKSLSKIRF